MTQLQRGGLAASQEERRTASRVPATPYANCVPLNRGASGRGRPPRS